MPDDKIILDKLAEFGLGGGKLPVVGNGGHWATPELVANAGKDVVQGIMIITAGGAGKGLEDIERRYMARTKEPWMLQEPIMAYGHIMLLADSSGPRRQRGPAESRGTDPSVRFARRPCPAVSGPACPVRRGRPAGGCEADDCAVAEWTDRDDGSGGNGGGGANLAEGVNIWLRVRPVTVLYGS